MDDKVIIFDTTLRDGEQSPGATMNTAEKLRIASKLEELGVDVIEAGFPASSPGDFDAVRQISDMIKNSSVCGLARALPGDIKTCADSIKSAKHPRIHTFVSTSEIHLKYQMKKSQAEVIEIAREAVRLSRSLCEDVEFSAMDASRTDPDYLCRVFEVAIEAGARTLNIPDTVGYAIPDEFGALVSYVLNNTKNIDKAIVSVHCHNDLGLGTANTLAAIRAGARQAEVAINGIGERAGNTSLEEIVMALKTRNDLLKVDTRIDTTKIYPISRLVSMITGIQVQPNKAIVGANAFSHESGIHQDGVLKNPTTYEIMKPETIGLHSSKLVLGKHSGKHAIRNYLVDMGYNLSDDEIQSVFEKFKNLADRKKDITDEDLEALVNEGVLRSSDLFALEYIHISSGTTVDPLAHVKMLINGRSTEESSTGNGPIDAAYQAIAKLTRTSATLLRFSISALTGGTDAQGEVTVRLKEDGLVALGRGSDMDIITASAKAYINGLNRLEYLKANPPSTPETM
ncbi:MAG: 2-isopropylmalate synthase [Proteobacteria bacterium]|nr:2-isopropylmalate synthase [Pseudomonadota bacterium]